MRITALAIMICVASNLSAQVSIFNQKQKQKQYLLQQIAALQVYLGYLKDGYKIAKDGLDFIGDVKDGELNLHKKYFNSLKKVNPEVSGYYKVDKIKELQKNILSTTAKTKSELRKGEMMQKDELSYIDRVFAKMFEDCKQLLDDLEKVTTDDKLEMTDDQRLKRVDELFTRMQDNYTFCVSFGNEAKMLAAHRNQELNDLKTSRSVNGLEN